MRILCFAVALTLSVAVSNTLAAVSIEWETVDNSAALDGYTTVDLYVNSDEIGVCCAAMLMTLDSGSFYYFSYDSGTTVLTASVDRPAPDLPEGLGPIFSAWKYTTYVTIDDQIVGILSGGDAGGDVLEFSEQEIDVSWYSFDYPVGRVHMARITFTEDAVGEWVLYSILSDKPAIIREGTIADLVPEPASLTLLPLAGGLMLKRR